jgi:hypothetical protein
MSLPVITTITSSDKVSIFSAASGYWAKASLSTLLTWLRANFTSPTFDTTVNVPVTGFNYTTTDDSTNQWHILRPAGTLSTGTVVLPAVANCADGQEIIITTTQIVTTFTVNANGATAANGAPTTLAAGGYFKLRYNLLTTSWYRVA